MFSAIRALRSATRLGARRITTSSEALGLGSIGVGPGKVCHYNLRYDEIAQHEDQGVQGRPAVRSKTGAICVDTGKFTGRSPSDKYVVLEDGTRDDPNKRSDDPSKGVWWGDVNQEMDPAVFDELYGKVQDYYNSLDEFYVFDGYCGANPDSRRSIRFLGFDATQHHFVKNVLLATLVSYFILQVRSEQQGLSCRCSSDPTTLRSRPPGSTASRPISQSSTPARL